MSLSYREKQTFYQQMAQLIRAGKALPMAAEKLAHTSNAHIRALSRRLVKLLESDRTTPEAFDALRPELSLLERATLTALSRSGRLEMGLDQLGAYFGSLARARAEIIRASAYPLTVLHLGILLLNVQILVGPGGVTAFLSATIKVFGVLYGAGAAVALLIPFCQYLGTFSETVDEVLRHVPFYGKARRALAVSRFAGTLDLQLDAGINVIESVKTAADASQSGMIHSMAQHAVRKLREGAALGEQLGRPRGALPADAVDSILLAEETGEMHRVLPRLREEYEEEGLRRLKTAAEWLPKLLYFGVLIYMGWKIIQFYRDYLDQVTRLIDT